MPEHHRPHQDWTRAGRSLLIISLVSLFCLPVSAVAPTVASITPSAGINTTTVSITDITGTGFAGPASVKLTQGIFNLSHKGSISGGATKLQQPYGVAVSGNYAYVASFQSNALEIVNIANPAAPAHAAALTNNTGGAVLRSANSVFVSGNYAYLTAGAGTSPRGLEIVNITVPTAPVHEGFLSDGTGGALMNYSTKVFVSGNYAYVVSMNSNSLEIVDISTPSTPTHKGVITDTPGGAQLNKPSDVYVSGNYAYVASTGSNALEIVNIAVPTAPVHAGVITNGTGGAVLTSVSSVYVAGNYAYLASGGGTAPYGLEIVDISNPATPVHRGFLTSSHLSNPTSVYVSGNRAYVTSGTDWLVAVDVSDPANPQEEAYLQNGAGGARLQYPLDVTVSGNYAYVTARDSNALEIVDLADTTWYPKVYGTGVNVASATHIDAVTFDLTNVPAGVYNVIVSNSNGEQGVLTNGFTISVPPGVAFTGTPTSGTAPLAVQFNETSTNNPTTWNWSFGDGTWFNTTSLAVKNISHTYAATGTYTVQLIANNTGGSGSLTKAGYISVAAVPTPAPTATPSPVYTGSSGGGNGGDDTPGMAETKQQVIVNIGGNSAASGIAVTGTGLSGLVVTGMTQAGPGPAIPLPPGIVYQYLDITPVRYTTITGAAITFTVPLSWLEEHHFTSQEIMMYHYTGGKWVALPTTAGTTANGLAMFTATTPSFSLFAIVGQPADSVSTTPEVQTFRDLQADTTPVPAPAIQVPVASQITAVPVPAPVPSASFGSLLTPTLIGVCGIGLLGGGLLARRWWLRRQNPALFEER